MRKMLLFGLWCVLRFSTMLVGNKETRISIHQPALAREKEASRSQKKKTELGSYSFLSKASTESTLSSTIISVVYA